MAYLTRTCRFFRQKSKQCFGVYTKKLLILPEVLKNQSASPVTARGPEDALADLVMPHAALKLQLAFHEVRKFFHLQT